MIGFLDWLDRVYIIWESFKMCICLRFEFDSLEVTLCGWQNIKIQLLCNLCCLVAVVFICFPLCKPTWKPSSMPKLFLSQSLFVFSFSRVFSLYCIFSPNVCNTISHSIHWPFHHANTFTACMYRLPFSCCPSLSLAAPPFLCHIHKFSPPPLTRNDCETNIHKASKCTFHMGGWRTRILQHAQMVG